MKQIAINKVGNLLPTGHFTQHSVFKNIVNFVNSNNEILSIANSENYLSPNSIIATEISLSAIKNIFISNDKIEISNNIFILNKIEKHDSFFNFKQEKNFDLKTKITKFEAEFLHRFNKKSLSFLLDKNREKYFETTFEKAFVKYIKSAYNEIINCDFYEGVSKIKGAGFGLTPSGDDFIAGMLFAADVLKNFYNDNSTNTKKIRETAKGKNPISNSLIYYASKGAYYKRFKDFLQAFLYDENNLENTFSELLKIGETSSSDTLTGFLTKLKTHKTES